LCRDCKIFAHDGPGLMVPEKPKIDSAKKLGGATVCVQAGTTSEKIVAGRVRAAMATRRFRRI